MATTRRAKTPAVPLYNSKDEADVVIAQIAQLQRQRIAIASAADERISEITEIARVQTEQLNGEINELVKHLVVYAEFNRSELTQGNKIKTVTFTHGTFRWRLTPVAVTIKGAEAVLQRIRTLGLTQFIRTKETINKEAMASERALAETIEGVTFSRREEFVITPKATKLEIPMHITPKR